MTPDELRAAADVMRRAADGEPVQFQMKRSTKPHLWQDATPNLWNWDTCVYRIKPREPRERWLTEESLTANPNHSVTAWPGKSPGYKWVRFREVIEPESNGGHSP